MVRAARIWPNVYFGRPGSLVTLPWPRGDIDRSYERLTADFVTGTGQHLVSSSSQGSRPYVLSWNALHMDTYALMEQYWTGMNGIGPWTFIDPSMGNMLLPNQASATNNLFDTTGFSTSTGAANMGSLFSNSTSNFIHRANATRSLRWQFTVTAASLPRLNLAAPYRNWYGCPVVPTLPYTFSVWARPDGVVDSSITMAAKIQWVGADGTLISDNTSGDTVMTGWTKLTVSVANPPAGAVYGYPFLLAIGSTITTGASIYLDELLFEQDSAANAWSPGTGLRPVEIIGLPETSPFDARWRKGLTMSLRELVA